MDAERNAKLSSLWRAQIRQVAARSPRLAQALWRDRDRYYERFARAYRSLATLPVKLRRKLLRKLALTLAGAALLLALGRPLPTRAAVITVDGVVCTLAEAIDSANNDDAAGNGCVDGSGADTIDLQADIALAAPLPTITSNIDLSGNGHFLDGAGVFRVLEIGPGGNLAIVDAKITGGSADSGGGILNNGVLEIVNSTITGNEAAAEGGGVWNKGQAVIRESTISGNTAYEGAGIFNRGQVTVEGSTIAENASTTYLSGLGGGGLHNHADGTANLIATDVVNNYSGTGGGVWNAGALAIHDCTIRGNQSVSEFGGSSGGGIRNTGAVQITDSWIDQNVSFHAGGISNDGTLTIQGSTISGNSADYNGGGIGAYSGSVSLVNSTISGNLVWVFNGGGVNIEGGSVTLDNTTVTGNSAYYYGGGLYNGAGAALNLNRSIISGNSTIIDGPEVYNLGAAIGNNYNVIGAAGVPGSTGFAPGASDLVPAGALGSFLDPVLAGNGGPTPTHALVGGGEAIDIAPSAACSAAPVSGVDQRGHARNLDGDGAPSANECDPGAFEFDPLPIKRYLPLVLNGKVP